MSTVSPTLQRIRLTYARGEAMRYVSHLDLQLVWERTFRRARLPLAYSKGFSPHPRLHLASALPLGFLSRCELVDAWFDNGSAGHLEAAEVMERSQGSAPPGLQIREAVEVSLSEAALQTRVISAEYLAAPLDPLDPSHLRLAVDQILQAPSLPRERRNKPYDLRPLVEFLELYEEENSPRLKMRLSAREGATGRPEEVIDALGHDAAAFRVERLQLILE